MFETYRVATLSVASMMISYLFRNGSQGKMKAINSIDNRL